MWTPALINTLIGIISIVVVAIVGIGQFLSGQQTGWRNLADRRGEEIKDLERRLGDAEKSVTAAVEEGRKERNFLEVRIATLTGIVADMENKQREHELQMTVREANFLRLNHLLQEQLDAATNSLAKGGPLEEL